MTTKDDFIRLATPYGEKDFPCERVGVSWPPPQYLELHGIVYERRMVLAPPDTVRVMLNIEQPRRAFYAPAPYAMQPQLPLNQSRH